MRFSETIDLRFIAVLLGFTLAIFENRSEADDHPSFRNEVMAVLSRAGCNMGTCHGNRNGKGGFHLSLRGQSPDEDYFNLTRRVASRRVNTLQPYDSLLLLKPTMQIPHEGGRRFLPDSPAYRILHDWIRAGMPDDQATAPALTELRVSPSRKTLYAPDTSVQLRVEALFSNGQSQDVTALSVLESSAIKVTISDSAVVHFDQPGSTTVTVRYLDRKVPVRLECVPERRDFVEAFPQPASFVDEAIFEQLSRLRINVAPRCDDATFIRRAFLDLTGLLPTISRARRFVASADPLKRSRLIDELLASPAFNDFQALRWSDLLRIEPKTLDAKGVAVFHAWIRDAFEQRMPLNEFATAILAARGSTYEIPPSNFYRALRNPEARGEAAAQVFLGIRLQCARCHNHPFDRWTQDDYYSWSNYFARIDYKIIENKRRDKNDKHEFAGEQIVLLKNEGNVINPATGTAAGLRFLDQSAEDPSTGRTARQSVDDSSDQKDTDRLRKLASWMGSRDNERFARTQTNRIWFQLMGQGIVDPIDDFRETNPPSNPRLLDDLTEEFIRSNYDVRTLMRLIMNSQTYQFASETNLTNAAEDHHFSRSVLRRLTAEQTLDAISHVLQVHVEFGGAEPGTLAVQLAGVRNGGHRYSAPEIGDRFLKLFGKPDRLQSCECERTNETTLAQTFELVSGELINEMLTREGNRIDRSLSAGHPVPEIVDQLFWAALSRGPTQLERQAAVRHVESSPTAGKGLQDLGWALLNSNEFLFRR